MSNYQISCCIIDTVHVLKVIDFAMQCHANFSELILGKIYANQ